MSQSVHGSKAEGGGLPIKGTASLVFGIIADTIFINTVRESKIVTPKMLNGVYSATSFNCSEL